MRRELDVTKHDLARAHVDSTQLKERCKMLEKTLKETRELLRTREAEIEKLRRERDRDRAMAERRRSDMHGHGNHMLVHDDRTWRTPSPSRNSSASASTSTSTSMSTSSAATGLSASQEEDRARFRSAETYMTRIDSWSGAQVLQAVHDINSEILQFSAAATEMCNFLPAPASPSNPKLAQVLQDTTARIGPNMTRILASREHSQEPLLVQLALQGCVSLCIARALNSFCIGFPSKSDAVLAQIYNSMRITEPQPTSAKWRALTHQHIHSIYPTLTEYSVNELADTILRWCTDIFLLANCQSFSPPSTAQSPSLYLDQIRRISRSVMRLASVTREEIMSTSFEVTIADPSGSFAAGEMVDAFGDYGESHGKVLATMELGLRCITRVMGSGESMLEPRLLLQPKVVLESVLEVLDR
ncbi:hypothetical protein BDN70DRAFT_809000 [Pholiota conissans]|uniref:Uncharacterized protein n=1 Tax=Pholiota conissans TaxID=109636 RepID=A0A9P5Z109_9AGAR|nr:hypothetical protein BDN70DRAFT_809000 [Pholiota conissans]